MHQPNPAAMRGTLVFLALGAALAAHAQLLITDTTAKVIDFESGVGYDDGIADNDVMKGALRLNNIQVAEPAAWEYSVFNSGAQSLSSRAWAIKFQGNDDAFDDFNNNGSLENRRDLFQARGIDTIPGRAGNRAVAFDKDTWDDKSLTLRIKNGTGATVTAWNLGLDAWFNDEALNVTKLNLQVSTNHVDYATFATATSANSNTGWSDLIALGGTVDATVAAGGYLYLRINYDQNGRGNQAAFDNISVQAVPEPGTLAALAIGAAALARRRRKA